MENGKRLADHLVRAITGPMWHGPALGELLANISGTTAAARPVTDAHTIWEIAVHVRVWADVARERLAGRALGDLIPEQDWPPLLSTTEEAWSADRALLRSSYEALAKVVETTSEAALLAPIETGGQRYSLLTMIHGVIEHATYHAGQVALLKKSSRAV